jgi:hypothetical protein
MTGTNFDTKLSIIRGFLTEMTLKGIAKDDLRSLDRFLTKWQAEFHELFLNAD